MTVLLLLSLAFQYNRIVMNWRHMNCNDFWSTDGLPATCAVFRYPNLSEITNGPKKGKNIPPPPELEP